MEERLIGDDEKILKSAPNFRDFGGYETADGRRVRLGQLYRSQVLSEIEDEDVSVLGTFGIRAVCDLRSEDEQRRQVNRWPVDTVIEMILPEGARDVGSMKPGEWLRRLQEANFHPEAARDQMRHTYRRMPRLYADRLAVLLQYLARANAGPVLVHCTAGKDRTGFVCAMTLTALGVPLETVRADYLESARRFTVESIQSRMERYMGGPVPEEGMDAIRMLAGVDASYLGAALDGVLETHGSAEAWMREVAGLDDATRDRMRQRLLEAS